MGIKSVAKNRKHKAEPAAPRWQLRLYLANREPRSVTAMTNLKRLCEEHIASHYRIQVVDVVKHPERCQQDQILAIPTLVRRWPLPEKRVVGTLFQTEVVVAALELKAAG